MVICKRSGAVSHRDQVGWRSARDSATHILQPNLLRRAHLLVHWHLLLRSGGCNIVSCVSAMWSWKPENKDRGCLREYRGWCPRHRSPCDRRISRSVSGPGSMGLVLRGAQVRTPKRSSWRKGNSPAEDCVFGVEVGLLGVCGGEQQTSRRLAVDPMGRHV